MSVFRLGMFQARKNETFAEHALQAGDVTRAFVEEEIRQLVPTRVSRWRQRRYTVRSLRHAAAWAAGYVLTESEDLEAEFASASKGYHVVMLSEAEGNSLQFVFRLTTRDLDGWTQYGIELIWDGRYVWCRE